MLEPGLPEPSPPAEVVSLEPYPDVLLNEPTDTPQSPEARYETGDAMSLAFMTARMDSGAVQRGMSTLRP
jgi:hypothetical protein